MFIPLSSTRTAANFRCFCTTTVTEDPALEWGRKNPQLAEKCLQIPPFPIVQEDTTTTCSSTANDNTATTTNPVQQLVPPLLLKPITTTETATWLEDYWKWREWKFPTTDRQQQQHEEVLAKSLVSHVLSAPLTLAYFYLEQEQQHQHQSPSLLATTTTTSRHHWCCVGARAEATLPLEYWKELLVVITHTTLLVVNDNNNKHHSDLSPPLRSVELTIDFLGPDIHPQIPSTTLSYANSKLHLNWLYKGYLHDYVDVIAAAENNNNKHNNITNNKWNGFVLLNPGLGHAHLKEDWAPTLTYLFSSQTNNAPLLLTAHSSLDARRDWDYLLNSQHQNYDFTTTTNSNDSNALSPPVSNPFASRITYQDPFDASHLVQPNHSMVIIMPNKTDQQQQQQLLSQ